MSVTVFIPVYNGMPYLPEAVQSILGQTWKEFEFLIIDDGSTDGTAAYLDSLIDPRIRVLHQENRGLGATLNRGIEECRTDYLARMDADDISLPGRIALQMAFLAQHHDVVMLGTQVRFFAGGRQFAGPYKPLDHSDIQALLLKGRVPICHASCLFRTDALRRVGGYRLRRAGQDIDLFIRTCEAGTVANLSQVLYLIRVHRHSTCFRDIRHIVCARAYALQCARYRRLNKEEPTYDQFAAEWEKRGFLPEFRDRVDAWSAVMYRNALMDWSESKRIRGSFRMACAAVCRPEGVVRRIRGFVAARKLT